MDFNSQFSIQLVGSSSSNPSLYSLPLDIVERRPRIRSYHRRSRTLRPGSSQFRKDRATANATAFVMLDLRLWDTHPIHFPIDRCSQHEFLGHNGYFKLVMSRFQHIEACFLDKMDFDW
jgi:hypothetical protein